MEAAAAAAARSRRPAQARFRSVERELSPHALHAPSLRLSRAFQAAAALVPFAALLLLFAIHAMLSRRRGGSAAPSPTTPLGACIPALDVSGTRRRLSDAFDGAHSGGGGSTLALTPTPARAERPRLAPALAAASFAVISPLCDTPGALRAARDAMAAGAAAAVARAGALPPGSSELSFAAEFAASFAAADTDAASAAPGDVATGAGADDATEGGSSSWPDALQTPLSARAVSAPLPPHLASPPPRSVHARSPSSPPPRRPFVPLSISSPPASSALALVPQTRPPPRDDGAFSSPMPLSPAIFNASPSELRVHKLIVASEANRIAAASVAVRHESNRLAARAADAAAAQAERHAAFCEHAALRASAADALACGILVAGYFLYQSTARLGDAVAACGRPLSGLGLIGVASSPGAVLDAASCSFAAATAALGTVVATAGGAWVALRAAAAPRPHGGVHHDHASPHAATSLTCLFVVFVFGGGVAARAASALGGAGWRLCAAAVPLGVAHAAAAVPLPAAARAARAATAAQAVAAWIIAAVAWPALAVWLPFAGA